MGENSLPTRFLPAIRSLPAEIKAESNKLIQVPFIQVLLDGIPIVVMTLNKNRQIVLVNKAILGISSLHNVKDALGLRPGELLHCIHSTETEGGCGTTEFCRVCGAANAILSSQKGKQDAQECRISVTGGDALDLMVWATLFNVYGENFTLFSISDTTDEKRRRLLERIFFHDIMNSLSAVRAMAEILKDAPPENTDEVSNIIFQASERAINEINSQKELTAAENGEFTPKTTKLNSNAILQEIKALYERHEASTDKKIVISPQLEEITFVSDETLVSRVIGNMVKNALEASDVGEVITLKSEQVKDRVRFSIHNPRSMPEEVRLQVFQRSFSTKGRDRGLGTYSMRLLSERYLKGNVSFTSSEKEGTTFYATYPIKWDDNSK